MPSILAALVIALALAVAPASAQPQETLCTCEVLTGFNTAITASVTPESSSCTCGHSGPLPVPPGANTFSCNFGIATQPQTCSLQAIVTDETNEGTCLCVREDGQVFERRARRRR